MREGCFFFSVWVKSIPQVTCLDPPFPGSLETALCPSSEVQVHALRHWPLMPTCAYVVFLCVFQGLVSMSTDPSVLWSRRPSAQIALSSVCMFLSAGRWGLSLWNLTFPPALEEGTLVCGRMERVQGFPHLPTRRSGRFFPADQGAVNRQEAPARAGMQSKSREAVETPPLSSSSWDHQLGLALRFR